MLKARIPCIICDDDLYGAQSVSIEDKVWSDFLESVGFVVGDRLFRSVDDTGLQCGVEFAERNYGWRGAKPFDHVADFIFSWIDDVRDGEIPITDRFRFLRQLFEDGKKLEQGEAQKRTDNDAQDVENDVQDLQLTVTCSQLKIRLMQCDSPEAIYRKPVNEMIARFVGFKNFYPAASYRAMGAQVSGDGLCCIRPSDITIRKGGGETVEVRTYLGNSYQYEVSATWFEESYRAESCGYLTVLLVSDYLRGTPKSFGSAKKIPVIWKKRFTLHREG